MLITGIIWCRVQYSEGSLTGLQRETSRSLTVVTIPVSIVQPLTLAILYGSQYYVNCTLERSLDVDVQFTWFRNGLLITNDTN